MKPRVIWLDDEIHEAKLRGTVVRFSNYFDLIECETIEEFREKSTQQTWDAAILDVFNARGTFEDVMSAIAITDKNSLWFVFSGKDSITREDDIVRKILTSPEYARPYASMPVYEKSTHNDILIRDIENAVKNKRVWQVENQYENVLKIADTYLNDKDCRKHLLDILCAASGVAVIDSHLYYNKIRVILEWMFRAARKKGLLHDKCFDAQDRINLSDASLFMAGKPTKYSGVKCKVPHFPSLVSKNVKNILIITGGASHTTEVEDKDIPNLTAYWKEIDTPYLLFSVAFMLCDILIWFDKYLTEHSDVDANKLLWEDLEIDESAPLKDPDSYKDFVGKVERDEQGNYHVSKCLLSYSSQPPLGQTVRLIKIIENSKSTKELYPVFALKFDVLI